MEYSRPIVRLIEAFRKLPGVGPRSAQRMAWHVIEGTYDDAVELARAVVGAKKGIRACSMCHNYTDTDPCGICSDSKRDTTSVCVVESPEDVTAIERAGGYTGLYHVLGGAIDPSAGIGPEKIRIDSLLQRVTKGGISEIILATNPTLKGDTTAMYIAAELERFGLNITRPAHGIPAGAGLEFLDGATITRAIRSRQSFNIEKK